MRLTSISGSRAELSVGIQAPSNIDPSQYASRPDKGILRTVARQAKSMVATPVLRHRQPELLRELRCQIPFAFDLVYKGYRFGGEAALDRFRAVMGDQPLGRVLVIGCGAGYETEAWLRRRPRSLVGVDLFDYGRHWQALAPRLSKAYGCPVEFRQAVAEQLPFADNSFDVIHSQAVLEHILNMDQSIREMTRVLASGGRMWHEFGPLYFTYGGDHCIPAYGDDAGYDHLLLDDPEYQRKIHDLAFFKNTHDPHCSYWARENQFSFLGAKDYLAVFEKCLEVESVIVGISSEGLRFRAQQPAAWGRLIEAGVPEPDLLIQNMHAILRKR